MNYVTAIELAHQRMREIGKCPHEYHVEPVSIVGKLLEQRKGEIILKAYNEYYYLVNYDIYYGFVIMSDTGYFNADDYTENTIQEFTGLIRIIKTGEWSFNSHNQSMPLPSILQKDRIDELGIIPNKISFRAIDFIKVTFH